MVNATDALAFSYLDFAEAFLTPASGPGVFNKPVVVAVGGVVPNNEDGMVNHVSTVAGGDHTSAIALEQSGVPFDGGCLGLLSDGSFNLFRMVSNLVERSATLSRDKTSARIVGALGLVTEVRVVSHVF